MARRSVLLNQASAYFRLAAKADKAGNRRQAESYRGIAERKVRQNQRQVEYTRNKGLSTRKKV